MKIANITLLLDHLQQLYVAAGAKAVANDIVTFGNALRPHASLPVDQFVTAVKRGLTKDPPAKAKGSLQKRATSAPKKALPDTSAINQHVSQLRAAGTNRTAFDQAFFSLKTAKSLSIAEVAEIARQYSETVTKYKSKALAHDDISKAFVRQARFENKLL